MNLFISKLIDHYALYDLHRKRSANSQFSSVINEVPSIKDRESFYQSFKTDVNYNIQYSKEGYDVGSFSFPSLFSSGDTPNDLVNGEVFLNNHHDEVPNVIFIHGWRMSSFDRIKKIFHERIAEELKWNMYYFTLPYHFEREPETSLYSGEFMISANISRTIDSTRQAVKDLRALIQWIKKNKKGPVVLIGVSLGGFITNLVATLESEIDILTSIFYANRLSYSIWNTIPGKFIRKDLEEHGVNYEDLTSYWKITDPSQAVPKMKKDNILLISAKYDQYVHIEDADHLWEAWGRPPRYIYKGGHAGIVLNRKRIAVDTLSFIQNKLKR